MAWEKRKTSPGFQWASWQCAHCSARKSGDYAWVQNGREFCNETCATFYEIWERRKKTAV